MSDTTLWTLLVIVVLTLATPLVWRTKRRFAAALMAVIGLALAWFVVKQLPVTVYLVGVGAAVLTVFVVWLRRTRTSSVVNRWGAKSRRKAGVASTIDIARVASWQAARRKATTVRPSLGELNRRERARVRTTEIAVPLVRVGALRVWSLVEDVICVFGGPRTGKTGWLAGRVIDAPGAAVVTSTRTDLYDLTSRLRTPRGPVLVFNAVGLGDLPSTVTFDPLTGCKDPVTASERATDLLAAGSTARGGDREFWEAQARRVLASLLHAAALGDRSMHNVLSWVANPEAAKREVTAHLLASPATAYVEDAVQFLDTNERTRSSITSTIMPALGWLTNPSAALAGSNTAPLDVGEMLRSRTTVYLLGAEETQAAPLVCALTGHIAREARRLAAKAPGGRLDPPLTLALDEAALISPVPLDSWTADMGGRGVSIIAAFQSRAQMVARWGETGAAIILNNTASVMVFGGTKDRDDLAYWSSLAGDRDEPVETTGSDGKVSSRTVRKVPVLAPAQIANLPTGKVVVFRRGMPPVVGRARMAWKRRDVKAQARLARRETVAVVEAAETVTRVTPDAGAAAMPPPIPTPICDERAGDEERVTDGR